MREINKAVTGLSDCMKPTMFKDVVKAVQHTLKFNAEKGSYDIRSLALKLGHSLKKCAKIVKASALIVDDKMKRKEAEGFFDLCESEWNSAVSSLALQTLHVRKLNNPKRIPRAEDVKKVNQFLKEKGEGEGNERMELRQYTDRMMADDRLQEEVAQSLSSFERELTHTISRVQIRGKRGRPVAVLLSDRHKEKIECLNKYRDALKINKENQYLFARGGESRSPIRSADVLRKFSIQCNAKSPELLTSTSLRKHVATVSQILNLKDHELDTLAHFLGHDIRIHREYYHLPENSIQIAKVSKILIELEKGTIQNFAGKSLEEIQMDRQ
ncbi:uncharacterized protein [Haliotis cracherodii]|uniref:uncharacterized protein n=1 Tax=Haliotis cracherodii TaxID=6455 RepID=UPI0039E817D9